MGQISNPSIVSNGGEGYSINLAEMEQMTTAGINQLRSIPKDVDLDKIAGKAQNIMNKYKDLGGVEIVAADKEKKDFIGSPQPKKLDEYNINVDPDIEKRTKDNLRDESKTERPAGLPNLKPFQKAKASMLLKLRAVQSLLDQTKTRNEKNRLNYLKARITNDLSKLSSMENGQWNNPKHKTEKDTDGEFASFMKPENTKVQQNNLNDMIAKATIQSRRVPDAIKKRAMDELDSTQRTNIEQAVTELGKNDEGYAKEIKMLELALGKKSGVDLTKVASDDEEEAPEKDDKEDKGEDKEDKKDDKKEDKKDKKDDKGKTKGKGKGDIQERMKKLREKKKTSPSEPSVDEEMSDVQPEKPAGPPADMPMKDDLTAVFNRATTKTASYWEVFDGRNKGILRFTGANAYGKDLFKTWAWFSSKDYGTEVLARIREDGLPTMSQKLNAKMKMTHHASIITRLAKGDDDAKAKKDKEDKVKKIKEEKELKAQEKADKKKEKEDKAKENKKASRRSFRTRRQASANKRTKTAKADPKSVLSPLFQKFDTPAGKTYGKMWTNLYKNKNKKAQAKIKDLEQKLAEVTTTVNDQDTAKNLRARAGKALGLATKMVDKSLITADAVESTVEKLTMMDDISYSMMESWVGENNMSEAISEKKSAGKIKQGLSHIILQASKEPETMKDQLTKALMSKPKYAKLQELKNKAFEPKK